MSTSIFCVTTFKSDPRKFNQWIKEVIKYAVMSGKQAHESPMLVCMTSEGSLGDCTRVSLVPVQDNR